TVWHRLHRPDQHGDNANVLLSTTVGPRPFHGNTKETNVLHAHLRQGRPGVVVPMVALSLIGLLGFTAIAVDGGLLLTNRRHVQTAADAAALAAAIELFQNSPTGTDTSGNAAASARKTAADNGFTDKKNGVTVTVNIPPLSGTFANVPGYVEVIITM